MPEIINGSIVLSVYIAFLGAFITMEIFHFLMGLIFSRRNQLREAEADKLFTKALEEGKISINNLPPGAFPPQFVIPNVKVADDSSDEEEDNKKPLPSGQYL